MTVTHTLEVVHGLFDNLKVVMDGEKCYSVGYQTINKACSSRWQGIDGRHTKSTKYVQSTWNSHSC
jgi:hypothetical protein